MLYTVAHICWICTKLFPVKASDVIQYTIHDWSLLTPFFRSCTKTSISSRVVSLPTLTLRALAATSAGTPMASRMGEGRLMVYEWQAAPWLA